jgi:hypothetical protein
VLVAAAAVLALPGTANAGPVDDAVAALRADHLYVSPQATTRLDQAAVRAAIGDTPLRIAIMPAGAAVSTVRQWPRMISAQLPGNTIGVISGRYFYAGSDVIARGAAGVAATRAIARHKEVLRENSSSDITQALLDFVAEIKAAPAAAGRDARGGRYAGDTPGGGGGDTAAVGTDDTSRIWPWVAGGAVLLVLAGVSLALQVRHRATARSRARREEITALVARLDSELLPAGGGEAGRAMADAAARHAEADALLASASTDLQYDEARHVVLEGLVAAQAARRSLGRDTGPGVPPFDPAPAVRLRDVPDPAAAGADGLRAAPAYSPDTPYYHPGRFGVPTGWYPVRIPATGAFTPPAQMPTEPTGTTPGTR